MSQKALTCPLCAHRFDPEEHAACSSCPLQRGCSLVCCPACGYSMINPDRSKFITWISTHLQRERSKEKNDLPDQE
jgi:uncharacterized protein (DUF2225 family)